MKETRQIPLELLERAISAVDISLRHFIPKSYGNTAKSCQQLLADLQGHLLDQEAAKVAIEEYERGEGRILNPEVSND